MDDCAIDEEQADWRELAAKKFREYLDGLDEKQYLDDEVAAAAEIGQEPVDLYALFAEMTALKTEVALQSRNSQTLVTETREETKKFNQELGSHGAALEEISSFIKSRMPSERREARKNALLEITALRESIFNALESGRSVRNSCRSWFKKQHKTNDAFVEIMERLLAISDESLTRLNLTPVAKIGQPFDSKIMRSVAVTGKGDVDENSVSAVVRQGYMHESTLLSIADVEVKK